MGLDAQRDAKGPSGRPDKRVGQFSWRSLWDVAPRNGALKGPVVLTSSATWQLKSVLERS